MATRPRLSLPRFFATDTIITMSQSSLTCCSPHITPAHCHLSSELATFSTGMRARFELYTIFSFDGTTPNEQVSHSVCIHIPWVTKLLGERVRPHNMQKSSACAVRVSFTAKTEINLWPNNLYPQSSLVSSHAQTWEFRWRGGK